MAEEGTPNPTDPQQPSASPPANAAPADAAPVPPAGAAPVDAAAPSPLPLPNFSQPGEPPSPKAIDLLSDVNLNVKIELGRTRMLVEDVLKLSEGAVVELDKLAGDPVDVYVNDRHVARGEVLVLNDNFCVRINEILSPAVEGAKPTPAAPAPVKAVA